MSPKSFSLAAAALVFLTTATASAGAPTKLWLEAKPATCDEHLAALSRELTLACDAAGGACVVTPSEATADRRLALHCEEGQWTLQALTARGESAWTVDVYGSDADRVRSAAVFAVRAETPEPGPSRAQEAPAPPPSPTTAPVVPPSVVDPDRAQGSPKAPRFSLAAAPRAGVSLTGGYSGSTVGVSAAATVRLVRGLHAGLTGAAEAGFTKKDISNANVPNDGETRSYYSGGAIVGYGAPFERTKFGALVEGTYGTVGYPPNTFTTDTVHEPFASLRAALVYQLFESSPVRPWISPWIRRTFAPEHVAGVRDTFAGLDLGVAWDP